MINDFLLPFRCVNTTSGKSSDCDGFDVTTSVGGTETTFGGTGQTVFYTSQTKDDFASDVRQQAVVNSLDSIAESHGVNITAKIEYATLEAKAAKEDADAEALKADANFVPTAFVAPTSWTKLMSVEQYALPFFGIFDDNSVVVVSYTHEDSQAVPEYGMDRLMYAKTLLSFGIVPMIVGFILISMLDYKINTSKYESFFGSFFCLKK